MPNAREIHRKPSLIRILLLLIATGLHTNTYAHVTQCIDGTADGYPCKGVALAANLSVTQLGGSDGANANDIWGWTDEETGKEYVLIGLSNGTTFVDITVPDHPEVLGMLPTHSEDSLWRDIKVYADHAYIVAEANNHGMQVFDLRRLRDVSNPPQTFDADAHYDKFSTAHNIAINEDSGFAYVVGARAGTETCDAGLHMIDLKSPLNPIFSGCFSADGYTHDAQCVDYDGPDTRYRGREICANANEDTLTIVDVTDKTAPVQLARQPYVGSNYTHQGWFTEDRRWFLVNDELDEIGNGHNTRTYVWDMTDLEQPKQVFSHTSSSASSDHNLYIRDQFAYLANYASGLRILDLSGIAQAQIREVAFFDTVPADDDPGFKGAWSNYPFFASGTVPVSDMWGGLFVLQPDVCDQPSPASGLTASGSGDNKIDLNWTATSSTSASYEIYRELGGCDTGVGERLATGLTSASYTDILASGSVDYGYRVRVAAEGGKCSSEFSECVEARTTGACNAPPAFGGLTGADSAGTAQCAVKLAWDTARSSCSGPVSYDVYRSPTRDFEPSDALRIATTTATTLSDSSVESGKVYHYLVRAQDVGNAATENNQIRIAAKALGPIESGTWSHGAEPGEALFSSQFKHISWHVVEDSVHGGTRAYHSGYVPGSCVQLSSGPIDLGTDGPATLSFWHRFGTAGGSDGGVVEISTDKVNWEAVTPSGGYPNAITKAGNGCGLPNGTGVFSGTQNDWTKASFALDDMEGVVYLRWVFAADLLFDQTGWWVDDIEVTPAQVESTCSTEPAVEGFEIGTGTSGLWFNPERSGEGFLVAILNAEAASVTWFTYDNEGRQMWLQGLGVIDGDTIVARDMSRSEASGFGANFQASEVQFSRWGEVRLRFTSCADGNFSWNAPGFGDGTYSLTRAVTLGGVTCVDPAK